MKIIFGCLNHEANSFGPEHATFERWHRTNFVAVGDELLAYRDKKGAHLAGMFAAAEEEGVTLIPSIYLAGAAPILKREAFEKGVRIICDTIRANPDADGCCFCMHGAGIAEGIDDIESYLMDRMREAAGRKIPIAITCDLHANIKQAMIDRADAGLFGMKQYPHIDKYETGYLAMQTLIRKIRGEEEPVTAVCPLPLLIPCSVANTLRFPMKAFPDHMAAYCREHGLIDVTFFNGFPWADTPWTGASVVVVGHKGQDVQKAANELGQWVWEHRHETDIELNDAAAAWDKARAAADAPGEGYVVIHEASDNPGGGTPGDGTGMLREMLRRNEEKTVLGYIFDKEIVEKACAAGIGGRISGLLGGKTDRCHGDPVEIRDAVVCALSDGQGIYLSPNKVGQKCDYHRMARLRIGNAEVIVAETCANQTYDDRPFLLTGADINQYRIVLLKSATHFRSWFEGRAKAIVTANTPGNTAENFALFPYRKLTRPVYPLDPDMEFDAFHRASAERRESLYDGK